MRNHNQTNDGYHTTKTGRMDVFQPVFAAEAKLVNGRQKKTLGMGTLGQI